MVEAGADHGHGLDHKEHTCSDNDKIKYILEEAAVQYGGFFFYFFTVFPYRGIDYIFKRVKACPAGQGSQHRHQYIVHKGCDDLAESTADDNAHCHINDIALQDKCFKFLHYIV